MANFCRNCGVELKVGLATKICPKCGKEVGSNENVCVCGYSFANFQQAYPSAKPLSEDNTSANDVQDVNTAKPQKVYNTKGGRVWAIVALVLLLLFAYYIIAPHVIYNDAGDTLATLRPEFLVNFDGGLTNYETPAPLSYIYSGTYYGYDYVATFIDCIKLVAHGSSFGDIVEIYGGVNLLIMELALGTLIAMFVHLIICIVRICTGKRSKHANWTYLVLAIITTLVVGLIVGLNALSSSVSLPEMVTDMLSWFTVADGYSLGYAIWAIPIYFWFFFLYSFCAKAKKLKEQTA